MAKIKVGQAVPDFSATATGDETVTLGELAGQRVVIYFYPKDSTPGCTQEGLDFNAALGKFKRRNTRVFGVSRDSLKSHANFCEKQGFKFPLISDPEEKLCKLFDVIKMKNMYGKQVRGIERSTFLIDEKGILRHEWRGVKVKGHVEEVLEAIKQLSA